MPGRSFTVALTDDQAAILDQLAADREADPAALLLEAVAHGLVMIAAGVDESDLQELWDRPGADQGRSLTAAGEGPHRHRRAGALTATTGGHGHFPSPGAGVLG